MTTITPLYEAKIPRTDAPVGGYLTAEQELAGALEGQAPALAREVADLIGPVRTVNLARAISRAVAVGIRRRGEQATAELVAGAYDLMVAGLNQITDGCSTAEDETEPAGSNPAVGSTVHYTDNPVIHGGHARCFKAEVVSVNADGTLNLQEMLPGAVAPVYAISEGKPGDLYTWHCCHRSDPHEHTADGWSVARG